MENEFKILHGGKSPGDTIILLYNIDYTLDGYVVDSRHRVNVVQTEELWDL